MRNKAIKDMHNHKKYYCECCNISIISVYKTRHINTKTHIRNSTIRDLQKLIS